MAYFHFKVENTESTRLDKFLAAELPQYSRSFLAKCELLVNGKTKKPSASVKAGDLIEVKVPPLKTLKVEPEKIPLKILHEDAEILVIEKPSGMVIHPSDHGGNVSGTLVNALLFHLGKSATEEMRPGIVHRLDKETSGVMVVAKTEAAKKFLTKEFAERRVEKFYLALVVGRLKTEKGRIEAPLGRDSRDPTRRRVSTASDSREAITEFEVLENFADATLVRVKLLTGRTHQIRVHFQSLGHPIVGDATYASKKQRATFAAPRMFLHAAELKFRHPETKKLVEFEAELPEELRNFLKSLEQ